MSIHKKGCLFVEASFNFSQFAWSMAELIGRHFVRGNWEPRWRWQEWKQSRRGAWQMEVGFGWDQVDSWQL